MTQFQPASPDESTLLEGRCPECQLLLPIRVLQKHRLFCSLTSKLGKHDKCSNSESDSDTDPDLPCIRKYGIYIAGNFCMVEIFVYFVSKSITRKLKRTKMSLHNNVNMFYT